MNKLSTKRQLAAIMFTDIVGYTALMGDNSKKALELVHISKEIQKPLVEKHDGKWLKEMGDGALAQFNTALDAVNCAIEIQEQARAKFDGKLRIGIHLGDITIEDEDVYGDGVNVASRLEGIADPGGIYISDAVLKAIQGQIDIKTKYLGEIPLKNVAYDLRTYAIQGVGLPIPADVDKKPSEVSGSKKKYPLWAGIGAALVIIILAFYLYPKYFQKHVDSATDSDEISIAVLPFKNFSGDPELDPFCDGMTDAVISRLTKLKGISKVISMTSVMSYKKTLKTMPEIAAELDVTHILESSFQKSGDQVKVTLQLIDGPSDNHYWSDEFMGVWGDIFGIQAEVAENVARNMGATVSSSELEDIRKLPTNNERAYELYLQARFGAFNIWGSAPQEMKDMLEKAISLDSTFAAPYVELGYYWLSKIVWDGNRDVDYDLCIQNANEYLRYAISLDPENGDGYVYLGAIKLYFEQDLTEARELMIKGVELNPTSYNKQILANTILPALGEFEFARTLILEAMVDSPFDPGVWSGIAINEYFTGNYDKARETLEDKMDMIRAGNNLNNAARIYFGMKEYQKVIEVLNEYLDEYAGMRPSRVVGYLAAANYNIGNSDKFQKLLNELKQQAEVSPVGSPSFHTAFIYAQMGEIDTSFEWLEKAYEDHEVEMYWLKVEPPFEPLHDDPRWQIMLDKVGFPEYVVQYQ